MKSFLILFLSLKGASTDRAGELPLGGRLAGLGDRVTLLEKGLDVGVVVSLFHVCIIGQNRPQRKTVYRQV